MAFLKLYTPSFLLFKYFAFFLNQNPKMLNLKIKFKCFKTTFYMFLRDIVWEGIKPALGFMLSHEINCDLDKKLL